eukprot:Platyproteum_vivax@DN2693_c0_g1_i3.p1
MIRSFVVEFEKQKKKKRAASQMKEILKVREMAVQSGGSKGGEKTSTSNNQRAEPSFKRPFKPTKEGTPKAAADDAKKSAKPARSSPASSVGAKKSVVPKKEEKAQKGEEKILEEIVDPDRAEAVELHSLLHQKRINLSIARKSRVETHVSKHKAIQGDTCIWGMCESVMCTPKSSNG